jgi:hypothetical protein
MKTLKIIFTTLLVMFTASFVFVGPVQAEFASTSSKRACQVATIKFKAAKAKFDRVSAAEIRAAQRYVKNRTPGNRIALLRASLNTRKATIALNKATNVMTKACTPR